jgi:hypothetical protein
MPDDDLHAVFESAGRVGDKENAEGQRERLDRPRAAFTRNALCVQLTGNRSSNRFPPVEQAKKKNPAMTLFLGSLSPLDGR